MQPASVPAPSSTPAAQAGQAKARGSAPVGGAAMAAIAPAAAGRDQPLATDPDLMPPQSPARLVAHKEAKPLYEKGFALFARKEYDQSILVFRNFLSRFPEDIYSDNAQFWIGESFNGMNRPEEAEQAYRQVLRGYDHRSTLEGFKTPDAIYRLGQIYQRREDRRRARMYYEALAERFPETSAGRKAQRELDTMGMNTAAN
jgi:tol-pal system protein YbgF